MQKLHTVLHLVQTLYTVFHKKIHIFKPRTVRPSVPLHVPCISPIFFEVGIPNLVCGCILGWRSVAYRFGVAVTLTLTSDLVFIEIKCPSVRPASCPVHISYIL